MAGDVGRRVKDSPGYCGYIPSWAIAQPTVSTGPTARVDLSERHLRSQPAKPPPETCTEQSVYMRDMEATFSASYPPGVAGAPSRSLDGHGPGEGVDPGASSSGVGSALASSQGSGHGLSGSLSPGGGAEGAKRRHGLKMSTAPHLNPGLPPPIPFVGSTVQQEASADVTGDPGDRDFFSRLAKEKAQQYAQAPSDSNRRSDTLSNASKGHGGSSGLDCFHQASGVAPPVDSTALLSTASTPYMASDRRGACHPEKLYGNTSGGLKLNRNTAQSTYAKEFGTLGSNPRDRMPNAPKEFAQSMTSIDLAAGTAKSVAKIRVPGYMGHVPAVPTNVAKMNHDEDSLTQFHKSHLMLTTNHNMPGYSGYQPKSVYNDLGRPMAPTLELTTSGAVSKYVAEDTVERAMKTEHRGRTNALKTFFTRGEGEDVGQAADSYFQTFRPYEGVMKI